MKDDFSGVECFERERPFEKKCGKDKKCYTKCHQRLCEDEGQQQEGIQRKPTGDPYDREQYHRDLCDRDYVIDPIAAPNSMKEWKGWHDRIQPFTRCPLGWHISQRMVPLRISGDTLPVLSRCNVCERNGLALT